MARQGAGQVECLIFIGFYRGWFSGVNIDGLIAERYRYGGDQFLALVAG